MSVHRDATELDRITVKIHNMKRSASRDSPLRSTNHLTRTPSSRSVMGRSYDNGSGVPGDSPDRMSPDRLRRRLGRSPSPRSRYAISHHREEYMRGPPVADRPTYKVLCVSALHPKASDDFIKETLYREYKKFGDFSIRISHDLDEKVAYVCFRTSEDAREAKHHKSRIVLYDKIALVEPVYESSSRNEYSGGDHNNCLHRALMSVHRDATELDRITVKIHNMKRSASRDSPLRSTNHLARTPSSRSVMGRSYDNGSGVPGDSPDRMSPDRLRRRLGRSPSPRSRYAISPHREEYMRGPPVADRPTYKVLCVSALHPKASDDFIKETLYREYKKFGDFSIRISHDLDEKVAYVCFRTSEDAREAKHHKSRIVLYDKIALVEPVYESSSRNEYRPRGRSMSPPEYDRYHYSRSPMGPGGPIEHRRPPIDPYDRYGPPPIHPHPREYRGPLHHDYHLPPRGPPMHRVPPHIHGHPPPHQYGQIRHMGPRPHPPYEKLENKKDKFPNYLHHVQPEDDPLATRTLFAGNLEVNISDDELRRIFGKYGIVDDIDIKRPPPGTGNAFAFVRYQNLDMAHRAKLELSGQYIGKFQCKIGYGKVTPATRIWIGGLGAWTSVTQLEREFDRFGSIKKLDYQKGDTYAYIQYETVEAATAAVKEMRGFPLGGPERRLRTDFSELPGTTPAAPFKVKSPYEEPVEYRRQEYDFHYDEVPHYAHRGAYSPYPPRGAYRGRGGYRGRGRGSYHGGYQNDVHRPLHSSSSAIPPPAGAEDEWRRPPGEPYERARSGSRDLGLDRSRSRSPRKRGHSPDSDSDASSRRNGVLSGARTLPEIARKCVTLWQGALILKSSLFPAKFHLTDGDGDIVDSLMRDEDGKHHLRITQRLRLDPPKLEDVQKRISSSSSHAIFLGLAGSTSSAVSEDSGVQTRPLRNLVSYLKQKEAAGVISLLNKVTEATGVLYAFPPCDFSTDLLKRTCQNVTEEGLKEDHLVIVVVRGGTA